MHIQGRRLQSLCLVASVHLSRGVTLLGRSLLASVLAIGSGVSLPSLLGKDIYLLTCVIHTHTVLILCSILFVCMLGW